MPHMMGIRMGFRQWRGRDWTTQSEVSQNPLGLPGRPVGIQIDRCINIERLTLLTKPTPRRIWRQDSNNKCVSYEKLLCDCKLSEWTLFTYKLLLRLTVCREWIEYQHNQCEIGLYTTSKVSDSTGIIKSIPVLVSEKQITILLMILFTMILISIKLFWPKSEQFF